MRVVNEDRHRTLNGQIDDQAVEPAQDRMTASGPAGTGGTLVHLDLEHIRRVRRRAAEDPTHPIAAPDRRLKQLTHHAEPERPLQLVTARRQHPHAASNANGRAALTSAVLPIPGGPSTTTARP